MPSSRAAETEGADAPTPEEPAREPAAAEQEADPRAEQEADSRAEQDAGRGDPDPAAELERIEDLHRHALADLDNYRKRAAREVERRVLEAREAMVRDWLDVVDSVDRALQFERQGPCREGLEAVMAQIDGALERSGARRIGESGEQFDPARHEAVAVQPGDGAPDLTVLDVQRSGFALADRVIRPAHVVVARADQQSR
jgi:molecular chaperone GrpE